MLWLPDTIEKLSFTSVRHSSSSIVGFRKKGLPNLNVVANPIAVSAGTFESIAARGRNSRVYEKCASFTFVGDTVLKRFMLRLLIFDGPSMPFAETPYVATSNV